MEHQRHTLPATYLGAIPFISQTPEEASATVVAGQKANLHPSLLTANQTPESEAFDTLVGSVQLTLPEGYTPTVACLGLAPGCGTTTTAANLALALARRGRSILLIDANGHRAALHQFFGVPRSPGLLELLAQAASFAEAIRGPGAIATGDANLEEFLLVPGIHRFNLLPIGGETGPPPAPTEPKAIATLLRHLKHSCRLLVVDMGILTDSSSTLIPLAACDACWLVVPASPPAGQRALAEAVRTIRRHRLRLAGFVATPVQPDYSRPGAATTGSTP